MENMAKEQSPQSLFNKMKEEGWEEQGNFGDDIIMVRGDERVLFNEKNDAVSHSYFAPGKSPNGEMETGGENKQ